MGQGSGLWAWERAHHSTHGCLKCYANGRKRSNYPGHYGYIKPRKALTIKVWEAAEMKRPQATSQDGAAGKPAKGDLLSACPELWSYLTEDRWEDGGPRQRASLLIICDGPTVKLWLNDRATERTAWATGETLEQAASQLNEMLETDTVPWRTVEGKRKKS